MNTELDPWVTEEYLEECSSSVCPKCGHKVRHEPPVVRGDVWEYR